MKQLNLQELHLTIDVIIHLLFTCMHYSYLVHNWMIERNKIYIQWIDLPWYQNINFPLQTKSYVALEVFISYKGLSQ
jgi:hypothetical protein